MKIMHCYKLPDMLEMMPNNEFCYNGTARTVFSIESLTKNRREILVLMYHSLGIISQWRGNYRKA